jgi:hypothetical protein
LFCMFSLRLATRDYALVSSSCSYACVNI